MQTVELEQALNRAFQHHNAGQWQEAEALYRHILETVPDQPQTLHLLGLLCFQTGKREAAAELLAKAVTILPENAEALFHLGVTLQALLALFVFMAALVAHTSTFPYIHPSLDVAETVPRSPQPQP